MKLGLSKLDYTEPAVLRGIAGAVVGLATSLGVTSDTDMSGAADAAIVVGLTAWPIVQGLWTRARVWSPAAAKMLKRQADTAHQDAPLPSQLTDGPDHAAE